MRRLRLWLVRRILKQAKRAHVWAGMTLINNESDWIDTEGYVVVPEHMLARTRIVLREELDQAIRQARRFAFNFIDEEQITTERLARRYDPGMALNEAFQRAAEKIRAAPEPRPAQPDEDPIAAHYRQMREKPSELTDNQQAALKHQERFLRANLKHTPS